MKQEIGAYHDVARRLLAEEAGRAKRPPGASAAIRACDKLRQQLGRLVGPAGFDALMSRALHLARADFAFLHEVHGACLTGLAESAAGQDPSQVGEALVAVFGGLYWLLSTFIGEDLALRQIRRIWPEVPLSRASDGAEETEQ